MDRGSLNVAEMDKNTEPCISSRTRNRLTIITHEVVPTANCCDGLLSMTEEGFHCPEHM